MGPRTRRTACRSGRDAWSPPSWRPARAAGSGAPRRSLPIGGRDVPRARVRAAGAPGRRPGGGSSSATKPRASRARRGCPGTPCWSRTPAIARADADLDPARASTRPSGVGADAVLIHPVDHPLVAARDRRPRGGGPRGGRAHRRAQPRRTARPPGRLRARQLGPPCARPHPSAGARAVLRRASRLDRARARATRAASPASTRPRTTSGSSAASLTVGSDAPCYPRGLRGALGPPRRS